ncbi:MAG: hypothetical protein MZU91_11410 [Desulfosudis oleivorans]|nr:hypothetical protein [Desulfosudis oleivorans]
MGRLAAVTTGFYDTTPDHNPLFGYDGGVANLIHAAGLQRPRPDAFAVLRFDRGRARRPGRGRRLVRASRRTGPGRPRRLRPRPGLRPPRRAGDLTMAIPGLTIIGESINDSVPRRRSSSTGTTSPACSSWPGARTRRAPRGSTSTWVLARARVHGRPRAQACRSVTAKPLSIDTPDPVHRPEPPSKPTIRHGPEGRMPVLNSSIAAPAWRCSSSARSGRSSPILLSSERYESGARCASANRTAEETWMTARALLEEARKRRPGFSNDQAIIDPGITPLGTDCEGQLKRVLESLAMIRDDPFFAGVHVSVGLSNFTVMLPSKRAGRLAGQGTARERLPDPGHAPRPRHHHRFDHPQVRAPGAGAPGPGLPRGHPEARRLRHARAAEGILWLRSSTSSSRPPSAPPRTSKRTCSTFDDKYRKVVEAGWIVCITDNPMGLLSYGAMETIDLLGLPVRPEQLMVHLNTVPPETRSSTGSWGAFAAAGGRRPARRLGRRQPAPPPARAGRDRDRPARP